MCALGALLLAGCASQSVRARPVGEAVREGIDHLLRTQNRDGSWGSAGDTTGFDVWAPGWASHYAFRVATTALCVMALRATVRLEPDGPRSPQAARMDDAAARGVEYLLKNTDIGRLDKMVMYNVWGHTYAVQALSAEYAKRRDERLKRAVERHVKWLDNYETMYGGWNYYDFTIGTQRPASSGTSFGSGAGVVALAEAKRAGIAVPERMLERALRVCQWCRNPDGSYLYDYEFRFVPLHLANRPKGSLGRAQAPNYALWTHGRLVSDDDVRAGLEAMFRERRFLECGRKRQFPHEAYYFNSGYYYYYGHYYAARIVAELPPADRAKYAPQVLAGVLPFQETDGSWWDYRMYAYHKPYGTALALMTIARLR